MPSTPLSPDVLPIIGMTNAPAPMLGSAALLALGVWSLVAIGFYVWYLWSLSRLFPCIGLPSSHGWIPVWNQWQLVQRGGLPGWLVLLGVVPGLGIVVWVVSVIAIHRLNTEHGKGGGFTVLGALLPPVWAMLLARSIEERSSIYGVMPAAGAAAPGAPSAVPSPPGYAPQQPAPQQYSAPQHPMPQAPVQPWQTPEVAQAPAASAVPAEQPDALARLFAEPQQPSQPAEQPLPGSEWGFSRTTEGDYQRLAQEGYQQRPAPTLGVEEPVRPFAWPGIDESNPPPAPPARQSPTVTPPAAAPAVPAAPTPPPVPVPPVTPAPLVAGLPAVSTPVVAPAPQPPQQESFTTHRPSIFDSNSASTPHSDTETARSQVETPAPAAPEVVAAAAAEAGPALDVEDELDRTVVVPRPSRWGLELPDGDVLELRGDDVVVGRKPEPKNGSSVLQIVDPTRTLSKSHARLRRVDGSWTIEDLDSTNGVALVDELGEQVPLEAGREHPVTERLVLGTLEVTLRRVS
ncbi:MULTISPECIES: DUF5684 domain-containing protein [unclassified Leucobacter]|uniref:DUF5684 domain-containing protein n=1 Tax=unclassified Leucobacter TaxID=2621730 RepID=UPI003017B42B